MPDEVAKTARLMRVIDALSAELARQDVLEALANSHLDITALARAAIEASDGNVIPFRKGELS